MVFDKIVCGCIKIFLHIFAATGGAQGSRGWSGAEPPETRRNTILYPERNHVVPRVIRHNPRWRKGLRQTQYREVVYQYTSILIKVNQPVSLFWHGTYGKSCDYGE